MNTERLIVLLRIALGINFLWFGGLKFFPGLSPAEGLAINTIDWMFQGLISSTISIKLLAIGEVLIGIGLISGLFLRYLLYLFIAHMTLTFLPLFIFPQLTFTHVPYGLTMEGQYIIKNSVYLTLGWFLLFNTKEKERQTV